MIFLSIVFCMLTMLALMPVLIVVLGEFEGSVFARIEGLASTYDGVLVSLGTLFLVSALAALTTHISSRSSERREAANRRISSEMKISEFRQKWINELRDDVALFSSFALHTSRSDIIIDEHLVASRILLRMNPHDKSYNKLVTNLHSVAKEIGAEKPDLRQVFQLRETAQDILKREWDRLKEDLKRAELLENSET